MSDIEELAKREKALELARTAGSWFDRKDLSLPEREQIVAGMFMVATSDALETHAAALTRLRKQCEAKDAEIERLRVERDEIKKAAIRDANTVIECLEASNSNAIASLEAQLQAFREAAENIRDRSWNERARSGMWWRRSRAMPFECYNALMSALRMEGEKDGVE
jgi:chromosome segregation ATPase